MNNSEWMIKNKIDFSKLRITRNLGETFELFSYSIFLKGERIATITTNNTSLVNALLEWLDMERDESVLDMERDESVLNDAEKQYLRAVIEPFKYRFLCAGKIMTESREYEHIVIDVKSIVPKAGYDTIELPFFKAGEMYKGMEPDKEYTVEELGL